ncbi:hypothetical protein V5O48_019344, partial [Marasmius crinis-equi]
MKKKAIREACGTARRKGAGIGTSRRGRKALAVEKPKIEVFKDTGKWMRRMGDLMVDPREIFAYGLSTNPEWADLANACHLPAPLPLEEPQDEPSAEDDINLMDENLTDEEAAQLAAEIAKRKVEAEKEKAAAVRQIRRTEHVWVMLNEHCPDIKDLINACAEDQNYKNFSAIVKTICGEWSNAIGNDNSTLHRHFSLLLSPNIYTGKPVSEVLADKMQAGLANDTIASYWL